MANDVDAVSHDLWEEALACLALGARPEWVPEHEWGRARTVMVVGTDGWVGGHLGFLEDLAFTEAARRCQPSDR